MARRVVELPPLPESGKVTPSTLRSDILNSRHESTIERLASAGVVTSQTLDKALLTLSAGSIGVSLTFLDELLAGTSAPASLLYIAWGLFIVVIFLTLLGLRTAAERINVQMGFFNLLDAGALKVGGSLAKAALESGHKTESLIKRTQRLNDFALGLFVLALLVLFAFGLMTVQGGDMTKDRPAPERAIGPQEGSEKKGYTGDSIPARIIQDLEAQIQSPVSPPETGPADTQADGGGKPGS